MPTKIRESPPFLEMNKFVSKIPGVGVINPSWRAPIELRKYLFFILIFLFFSTEKEELSRKKFKCLWQPNPDSEVISTCNEEFYSSEDLGLHLVQTHVRDPLTLIKRWSCFWAGCSEEGVEFSGGSLLESHVLKHAETCEVDFICASEGCTKKFSSSTALTTHYRKVHNNDDDNDIEDPNTSVQDDSKYRFEINLINP